MNTELISGFAHEAEQILRERLRVSRGNAGLNELHELQGHSKTRRFRWFPGARLALAPSVSDALVRWRHVTCFR